MYDSELQRYLKNGQERWGDGAILERSSDIEMIGIDTSSTYCP